MKVEFNCDGMCGAKEEGRMKRMGEFGGDELCLFRPPRGWYVCHMEMAPAPGDTHPLHVIIGVCPSCAEKGVPLGALKTDTGIN